MRLPIRAAAAALLLGLSACHLLDQTDFHPPPPVPPAPPPIPNPEARRPLVVIEYAKSNPDYAATLTQTIQTVESRFHGVLYDVVAVAGDPGAAPEARARAAEVMTTIEAAGVIPARIQLGLAIEPGRKVQQVRVYLR